MWLRAAIPCLLVALSAPTPLSAQQLRIEANQLDLKVALDELREASGANIIFAHSAVQGIRVSCVYAGAEVESALGCLLRSTDLVAERRGNRDYLIRRSSASRTRRSGVIAGAVVDRSSGQVLSGTHVLCERCGWGSVTDAEGRFTLPEADQTFRLRFSHLGYRTLDTLLSVQAGPHYVEMVPVFLGSTDVMIVGNRRESSEAAVLPGVVSLPSDELAMLPSALPGKDLFGQLEWLPGVQKGSEWQGGLSVRGGQSDENLYLLEGAPVYHPWHAFNLVSTFQTDAFKDVQFYKGSFPSSYGGMLSSVLDAQFRDGRTDRPTAVVALNTVNARMLVEGPVSPSTSFMVSARRSYIDKIIGWNHAVEDELGRRDTLRTGYVFSDWSAKVNYRASRRASVSVSYYSGRDHLDLRLPFDFSLDFSSWLKPSDLYFEVGQQWGNDVVSVRYQHVLTGSVLLRATMYESRYDATERTLVQPTTAALVVSDYDIQLRDRGVKVELDVMDILNHDLRVGFQAVSHRFNSGLDAEIERSTALVEDVRQTSRIVTGEYVFFAHDSWSPLRRLRLDPGVRVSTFGLGTGVHVLPRLAGRYVFGRDAVVLRAAVGSEVQYLHRLRDRHSVLYDLLSSRWIPVGGQTRPSTSRQVSAGLDVVVAAGWRVSADVYYRTADGILLPKDEYQTKDGLAGPGIEVAALLGDHTPGRSRSYGFEMTSDYRTGDWRVLTTLATGRSLNIAPALGEIRYRASRFDIPLSASGHVQRVGRKWEYALSATIRSGYPYSTPVARYVSGSPLDDGVSYLYRPEINNARLPVYARVDISVAHRFGMAGASWRAEFRLYNVTNTRNVVGRSYDPESEYVRVTDRTGFPLLPLFELEMRL